MKEAYPTFIARHGKTHLVFVPDWDIYTEGIDFVDAMEMARDAIGLKGIDYEDDGKAFPNPSSPASALKIASKSNGIFDYSKGMLTMIDVDFVIYRKRHNNRMIKKNCTIPYYLSVEAEKEGINFSRVLQEALMERLNLTTI